LELQYQEEVERLRAQLLEKDATVRQLEAVNAQHEVQGKTHAALERKHADQQSRLEELMRERTQVANMGNSIHRLNEEITTLKQDKARVAQVGTALHAKLDRQANEIGELLHDNAQLLTEVETLSTELEDLQSNLRHQPQQQQQQQQQLQASGGHQSLLIMLRSKVGALGVVARELREVECRAQATHPVARDVERLQLIETLCGSLHGLTETLSPLNVVLMQDHEGMGMLQPQQQHAPSKGGDEWISSEIERFNMRERLETQGARVEGLLADKQRLTQRLHQGAEEKDVLIKTLRDALNVDTMEHNKTVRQLRKLQKENKRLRAGTEERKFVMPGRIRTSSSGHEGSSSGAQSEAPRSRARGGGSAGDVRRAEQGQAVKRPRALSSDSHRTSNASKQRERRIGFIGQLLVYLFPRWYRDSGNKAHQERVLEFVDRALVTKAEANNEEEDDAQSDAQEAAVPVPVPVSVLEDNIGIGVVQEPPAQSLTKFLAEADDDEAGAADADADADLEVEKMEAKVVDFPPTPHSPASSRARPAESPGLPLPEGVSVAAHEPPQEAEGDVPTEQAKTHRFLIEI
jgi:hypothetical protein